MLVFLVEFGRICDLGEGAVDLDALKALLLKLGKLLSELTLAPARDGSEQIEPRALLQLHHAAEGLEVAIRVNQAEREPLAVSAAGVSKERIGGDLAGRADEYV